MFETILYELQNIQNASKKEIILKFCNWVLPHPTSVEKRLGFFFVSHTREVINDASDPLQ